MKPTNSMIAAVRKIPASERLQAAKLAEQVFFKLLDSPVMADAKTSEERRSWAGEAAAAEVAYRFA